MIMLSKLTCTVPQLSPHAFLPLAKLSPLEHVHVHVDDAERQLRRRKTTNKQKQNRHKKNQAKTSRQRVSERRTRDAWRKRNKEWGEKRGQAMLILFSEAPADSLPRPTTSYSTPVQRFVPLSAAPLARQPPVVTFAFFFVFLTDWTRIASLIAGPRSITAVAAVPSFGFPTTRVTRRTQKRCK